MGGTWTWTNTRKKCKLWMLVLKKPYEVPLNQYQAGKGLFSSLSPCGSSRGARNHEISINSFGLGHPSTRPASLIMDVENDNLCANETSFWREVVGPVKHN